MYNLHISRELNIQFYNHTNFGRCKTFSFHFITHPLFYNHTNSSRCKTLTRNSLKAVAKTLNLKDNYYNYYSVNKIIEWLQVQGYQVEVIQPKYKGKSIKYICRISTDF